MSLALRYAVRSDQGLVRGNNEDSVYAGPRLLAVADGIGGQVGGDTASRVVIATFAPLDEDSAPREMLAALRDTVQVANAHLRQIMEEQPELNGMGSTLTAMLFDGARLGMAHVGDSRAYLLRGRKFSQITKDQTFVQALVDEGRITPEEASNHPQRSVILRALAGTDVDPDLSVREARLGERYLLCSDGLSDYVSGDNIAHALRIEDPHEAADRLIELALRAGGRDNITCIVADIVDEDEGDDVPVVAGAASDVIEHREVHPTSAAARAAIAVPPGQADVTDMMDVIDQGEPERPRHWWQRRGLVIPLVALVVLAGALSGLYAWTQTQYFVSAADGRVAIFKGVNVSLAGARLYHPVHTSDLAVGDLITPARQRVKDGLSADSRSSAEDIITNLSDNELLPRCAPPKPSPTPSPSASPSTHRAAGRPTPTPQRTPTPRTTATPRSTASRHPVSHGSPKTPVSASHSPSPTVAVSSAVPVPGKDCR